MRRLTLARTAGQAAAVFRGFLCMLLLSAASSHASVIIVGTRVIYKAGARDVSVRLLNRGDRPALVQAWLDRGDPHSTPESVSVPFALTPSLARIDPERGQVLRLVHTGEPLPDNKESVFWLNLLEVPPKPTADDGANVLQFAVRTRIKVFYRPKPLKDGPLAASRSLQWRLSRDGESWTAEARNPSAYFVSFSSLSLRADAKSPDALVKAAGGMVGPGETQRFPLGTLPAGKAVGDAVLKYTVIDDYGALVEEEASLRAQGAPSAAASQATGAAGPPAQ